MCILQVREMGRVHETIREMPAMQTDQILQQGMSEKRLGVPSTLVCGCYSMIPLVQNKTKKRQKWHAGLRCVLLVTLPTAYNDFLHNFNESQDSFVEIPSYIAIASHPIHGPRNTPRTNFTWRRPLLIILHHGAFFHLSNHIKSFSIPLQQVLKFLLFSPFAQWWLDEATGSGARNKGGA